MHYLNLNKFNFSTKCDSLVSPIKKYVNARLLKDKIFEDNKDKSGIYRWVNNKTYVGSGVNLTKRLRSYFNEKELNKNPRPIHDALIKYGLDNFTLEILEYCSKTYIIEREQFYLNLLVPDYNILKYAYSLLGFKHSQETIDKLKDKIISSEHKELLSSIHKSKFVSSDTRNKLSIAITKFKQNNPLTPEALDNIRSKTTAREGVPVLVLNTQTNEEKIFTNQTEAGKFLGVTRQAVYNAITRNTAIKGVFLISKIKQ
jgi:group I intron endonuclease